MTPDELQAKVDAFVAERGLVAPDGMVWSVQGFDPVTGEVLGVIAVNMPGFPVPRSFAPVGIPLYERGELPDLGRRYSTPAAPPRRWAVGFLLDEDDARGVVLIRKNRPEWQAGMLNGVGGKVEPGEPPLTAMLREFYDGRRGHRVGGDRPADVDARPRRRRARSRGWCTSTGRSRR